MRRSALHSLLWLAPAVAIYAACFSLNVGGAWYGGPAQWHQLAVTVIYILFCAVFTWNARSSRGRLLFCRVFSALTLAAGVTGHLSRALPSDWLVLPALVLTPFSSIPLYGLRYFTSWTVLELISITLSSLWFTYSLFLRKSYK